MYGKQKCFRNSTTIPWPSAHSVWEQLHADFLGPFCGKIFIVIVDSFSKWPEAYLMSKITAAKTIYIQKSVF